jgi:hypothetical protein
MRELMSSLESDLGALELRDGTLALVEGTTTGSTEATTATTATTTTTATEAATAAATTEATTTTTAATTTAAEATTVTTSGAGSREVETDGTTLNLLTVEGTVSSLGLINRSELNVTEAFGATGLLISGETDAEDGTLGTEDLVESILSGAEGKVANEEGVALGAGRVAVRASTVLGAVSTGLGGLTGSGVVEVDGTAVKIGTLLGIHGLDSIGSAVELDVTETAGAASLTVGDDAASGELTELGELTLEPLLVDIPGEVANEEVGRGTLGNFLSLGLLGSGLGLGISLALLGRLLGVGVGAVRVGTRLRVGRLERELVMYKDNKQMSYIPRPSWPQPRTRRSQSQSQKTQP